MILLPHFGMVPRRARWSCGVASMWFCTNCQNCYAETAVVEHKNAFVFLYGGPIKVADGGCTCDGKLVHYDTWDKFKDGNLSQKQFASLPKVVIEKAKSLHADRVKAEESRKPTEEEEKASQMKSEREQAAMKLAEQQHNERVLFLSVDIDPPDNPKANSALVYAGGKCSLCEKADGHSISESGLTRYYAEMIHWYISNRYKESKTKGFMIGVANRDGFKSIAIAFSGSQHDPKILLQRARFLGMGVDFCPTDAVVFNKSISGRVIPKSVLEEAVTVVGKKGQEDADSRDTTGCAASKLLVRHILKTGNAQGWHMTEMAYGTISGYEDGEPARSCPGCKVMLPCLLCNTRK